MDFIGMCLEKDKSLRATASESLESSWFKCHDKDNEDERNGAQI
jgi:serine/threonine protein kinase